MNNLTWLIIGFIIGFLSIVVYNEIESIREIDKSIRRVDEMLNNFKGGKNENNK
ncbi:MAG: hypothetical protein QXF86_03145 [Candidatus Bilamarchaeaceae archaeon]